MCHELRVCVTHSLESYCLPAASNTQSKVTCHVVTNYTHASRTLCMSHGNHACDVTHAYGSHVWRDSFIWFMRVMCLIHLRVTWLMHIDDMRDMTHSGGSCVWRDSLIFVWLDSSIRFTWLIYKCVWFTWLICDSFIYVWCDSCIWFTNFSDDSYVTWRVFLCYMTYPCMWRDSIRVDRYDVWPPPSREPWLLWDVMCCVRYMTYPYMWRDSIRVDGYNVWLLPSCEPWLVCDVTWCCVLHDVPMHMTWLSACEYNVWIPLLSKPWLVCDVTCCCVFHDSPMHATWLNTCCSIQCNVFLAYGVPLVSRID